MNFDYGTLLISIAGVNFVYLILFTVLSISNHKTVDYTYWIWGFAILCISHVLIALVETFNRSFILITTNALIFAGFSLLYCGLQKFSNKKISLFFLFVLFIMMLAVNLVFIYMIPHEANRRIGTSVLMMVLTLHVSVFFLKQYRVKKGTGWIILLVMGCMTIIAYSIRINQTISENEHVLFNQNAQNLIVAISFFLNNIFFGLGIFALLNQKRLEIFKNQIQVQDTLLSSIGHDLKEPLAHIYKLSNLYNNSKNSTLPHKSIVEQIEILSFNANHLAHNLLNWTQFNKEKLNLEIIEVNINALLEKEMELYKPIAKNKGIDIRKAGAYENLIVYTDKNMVSLIIRNLLNNAVKYSPSGSRIVCTQLKLDEMVSIEIQDQGPGITSEQLKTLNNSNTKTSANSKGVGIQLCHWYAEKLGGKIFFISNSEAGTTAKLEIPSYPKVV